MTDKITELKAAVFDTIAQIEQLQNKKNQLLGQIQQEMKEEPVEAPVEE